MAMYITCAHAEDQNEFENEFECRCMAVTVTCTCVEDQKEFKWRCDIGNGEVVYVDAIREFYMRENILVCSEYEHKNGYRIMYVNPKIIRVYNKKENVRILEVWV